MASFINYYMQSVALVFPHQLFRQHPALHKSRPVVLIEEWLYFKQYNFHKQKLILHRASMQFYKEWLEEQGYKVLYIETGEVYAEVRKLVDWLSEQQCAEIHYADATDDWLQRRLQTAAKKYGISLYEYATPMFLNKPEDVKDFFDKNGYYQTDFYIQQRKARNILLTPNKQPEGGKWTYDKENRKKFPKNGLLPQYHFPPENKFVKEAKQYVQQHFAENYGDINCTLQHQPAIIPATFDEAEKWLDDFLENRFSHFGVYEDAIVPGENILYHSMLSPLLNTGLLTPDIVLPKAMEAAETYKVHLNALEGFIRQIVGWREYMQVVYKREGRKQRTQNFWDFTRAVPYSFWTGKTGIAPVDDVIKKLLQCGYSHHIERLMIMGNFMLLCEFNPHDVYRWYMEMYIDSYDWVMVPNTYGLTQFADGGLMMTKPYISSSNYILKMSNYKNDNTWQPVWDGLFWRFMHVHRAFFESNPRLSFLLKMWDKMNGATKQKHLHTAEKFLSTLDESSHSGSDR